MADKESASYEAANQQKQSTTIHLPSLTSKPLKHQHAAMMKDSHDQPESAPSPSGYYLNVAQKGKLILPTALWILLIVAGVSFLTLLASLNRTLDTLDTIVEVEQERDAQQSRMNHLQHDLHDEHHGHHRQATNGRKRGQAEEEEAENSGTAKWRHKNQELEGVSDDSGLVGTFMLPLSPGGGSQWFSLPSWASLEPVAMVRGDTQARPANQRQHADHGHNAVAATTGSRLVPPQIETIMDDMVRQMVGQQQGPNGDGDRPALADGPEISGSFIISTSPDGNGLQINGSGGIDGRPADRSAGLMDSIFKQVLPMLDLRSLMGSSNSKRDQEKNEPPRRGGQRRDDGPSSLVADSVVANNQQQQVPALITANIENLNMNLGNTGSNDEAKTAAGKTAKQDREEIEKLDKSIDSIVSKLLKEPSGANDEAASDKVAAHRRPKPSPLDGLLGSLGLGLPMMVPIEAGDFQPGKSPFASMLDDDRHQNNRHHHHPPHGTGLGSGNSLFNELSSSSANNNDEPQMIISISSDEPLLGFGNNPQAVRFPVLSSLITGQPANNNEQAQGGRHHHQSAKPSRRPSFPLGAGGSLGGQSLYELPIGSPLSSLIDSFRDFDQTMAGSNKNAQQHSTTNRPKDELQRLREDAKWDVLSNDLADSFLQSMLQLPGGQHQEQPQSIMLVNGKPLADSERQKFLNSPLFPEASREDSNKTTTSGSPADDRKASTNSAPDNEPSSIGDVLSLLFRPEGGSSILSTTPSSTGKDAGSAVGDNDLKSQNGEQVSMDKMLKEMKDTLEQSILAPVTIIKTDGDQNDSLALQLGGASTSTGDNQATSKGAQDSNDSLMNDLIGTMFTLPQFGDSSSQQDVASSSSGGSSSGGGSSSSSVLMESTTPVSIVSTTTTTTTTTKSSSLDGQSAGSNGTTEPTSSSISVTKEVVTESASSKPDDLSKDSFLKGLLGLGDSVPFFVKEEEGPAKLPIATTLLTAQKTLQPQPASTTTEATTSTTTATTQTTQPTAPVTTSSNVPSPPPPPPTTPTQVAQETRTTTVVPVTVSSTVQPASSSSSPAPKSTPFAAEMIRESEAPLSLPMIDLAPFARASGPSETRQKVVAATMADDVRSSPLPPNSLPSGISPTGSTSVAPTTTTTVQKTQTNSTNSNTTSPSAQQGSNITSSTVLKSFLDKADDFIGRNLLNFKKLF